MVHFPADSTPVVVVVAALLFISQIVYGYSSRDQTNITTSYGSCIEGERKALIQFRQSLVDKSNRLSSWTGKDCCAWRGVGCSKNTGNVVKLDLRNSDQNYYSYRNPCNTCLAGQLNPSLVNLKYLRYLDLSWNNFSTIQIPTFLDSFKDLRYLNLSCARFYGEIPPNLANLSNLQYLDFGDEFSFLMTNNLYWVASLHSLQTLSLSRINLSHVDNWLEILNMLPSLISLELRGCGLSNIPHHFHSLFNFTSLASIDLSSNYFNSNIPHWLFNLTSLVHLDLSFNYFYGSIPDNFGELASLIHLDLSWNPFQTSLPKSLWNLTSLVHLDLYSCNFQGSIPTEIGVLENLSKLNLAHNELKGSIPSSLRKLEKLEMLDISGNSFSGVLFEKHFEELTKLKWLAISGTSLTFNVSSSWVPPFQLQYIGMRSIKVGPQFPIWLKTQREVKELSMSNASISGAIPHWFGNIFHTDFDYLDLSYNNLTGKPPLEFKQANNTQILIFLHSNKFEGSLNSVFTNILELYLSTNLLTGSIPQDFCRMKSLQTLYISNNLLTGRIPSCLGNLTHLFGLVLSNNNLSGHIPSSLGNLESLSILRLQSNNFHGGIPRTLCQLSQLRELNLRMNNLSGRIPQCFCKLSGLLQLNLANNNLTGFIPQCTQ